MSYDAVLERERVFGIEAMRGGKTLYWGMGGVAAGLLFLGASVVPYEQATSGQLEYAPAVFSQPMSSSDGDLESASYYKAPVFASLPVPSFHSDLASALYYKAPMLFLAKPRFESPTLKAYSAQLRDFESKGDGWLGEGSLRPTTESIGFARRTLFRASLTAGLPLPWLYPTFEGGVSGEWEVDDLRISVSYNPEEQAVTMFKTEIGVDDFEEIVLSIDQFDFDSIVSFFRS